MNEALQRLQNTQKLQNSQKHDKQAEKTKFEKLLSAGNTDFDKLGSLTFKSQRSLAKETGDETSNGNDQSDADEENGVHRDCDDYQSDSDVGSNQSRNDDDGHNSKGAAFQLPKRSAHSSRVIKPNKRFTDESKSSSIKNGKRKGAKAEILATTVGPNKEGKG